MPRIFLIFAFALASILPGYAQAQNAQFTFGSGSQDGDLPVEVTADNLSIDQNNNTAVFSGNVLVGQGEMKLTAQRVLVNYKEDQSGIESLEATGGVTLVSGPDAAESNVASYIIDSGLIEMNGDVLLVQGSTTLAAQKMVVNTQSGTAEMSGRVKTVLKPQGEN